MTTALPSYTPSWDVTDDPPTKVDKTAYIAQMTRELACIADTAELEFTRYF